MNGRSHGWRIALAALSLLALLVHGRAVAQPQETPRSPVSSLQHIALPAGEPIDLDQPVGADGASIAETRRFHGLAHYLNGLRFFRITADGMIALRDGDTATLGEGEWFAAVGRFNVLAIRGAGTGIAIGERDIRLDAPAGASEVPAVVVSKPQLRELDPVLDRLRYAHLWSPLAALSKSVEAVLVFLERITDAGWAIALILFAILVKLVLLPVSLATAGFQREVSAHRAALAPVLASIKKAHDGEEAHNRIMAAHKARGITPFYTLKPMLGLFILLPVLIAIFNALAEMPQFAGAGFLWIRDLAYPDDIFGLPGTVPFIGRTFNLLPWLMALVSVAASLRFRDVHASPAELSRKRRGLLLMAATFLLLFYPFPAAMVLYWLLNNLLQAVQQELWK
ncbi:MAG: membrane protein insertase YidC [Burkholderiaceae bacterium]|jgi:YidC/Oxa1 family membrane protein insertase|nr:membrane protein insertase YidC [Burkholderiaceae bacterium]MEB2319602.1 membrane protein insertase YidC [Pseudomonadota bacterium]